MIYNKENLETIYLILICLNENYKVDHFYIKEILYDFKAEEQILLFEKFPNIYSLDHWFDKKEDCENALKLLNNKKETFCILDYYRFRFNVTFDFVKHNKRMFQKLTNCIKRSNQKDKKRIDHARS